MREILGAISRVIFFLFLCGEFTFANARARFHSKLYFNIAFLCVHYAG